EIKGPSGGSSARNGDISATDWQLYDMGADPGEKTDLAKAQPSLVAELSARYEAWYADISREGLTRFPLPVGHAEENPVELHAPQAFYTGPMHFASGPGFANDWLTDWSGKEGRIWFELDAVAGRYEVEVDYACEPVDAGSRLRITAGTSLLEITVPAAPAKDEPLPHRDEKGKERYRNRTWATLKAGMLELPQGAVQLSLDAVTVSGRNVLDFKQLRLNRVP
ncbi:MAG: hypothetical protein IT576_10980, partial [Verrucomicrobiales bacterium]|nr:hypothetical protein [Verrucomicrobiales bacterium]